MSKFDKMMEGARDQDVVFVPMYLPRVVFEFIQTSAVKRGISPGNMVNKIFLDKLKEMAEEDGVV